MPRRPILIFVLILACGFAAMAATITPTSGTYALNVRTGMDAFIFPKNEYRIFRDLSLEKPPALKLDGLPMIGSTYYGELRLGNPARSYYLLLGRTGDGCLIDVIYFDANADGIITQSERLQAAYTPMTSDDNEYELLVARPVDPVTVSMTYQYADGTTFTRNLALSLEAFGISSLKGKKGYPFFGFNYCLETWFSGEIEAKDGRLLKVAVVDGNQNGIFNEPKEDYLLTDANYDGRFDWAKERSALSKTMRGANADGKRATLLPYVAPWPQILCLSPKGSVPDPAQLESK